MSNWVITEGWTSVKEQLPPVGKTVQICYKRRDWGNPAKFHQIITQAEYHDGTEPCEDLAFDFSDCFDCPYDEEKDLYLAPKGWYETMTSVNSEYYCTLDPALEIVTHWRPLPDFPEDKNGL